MTIRMSEHYDMTHDFVLLQGVTLSWLILYFPMLALQKIPKAFEIQFEL